MKAIRNLVLTAAMLTTVSLAVVSCGSIASVNNDGGVSAGPVISTLSASDPRVQLVYARTKTEMRTGYYTGGVLSGDIELENLAYTKVVQVHYTTDGSTWKDANAWYVSSLGNNRERWSFSIDMGQVSYTGDPRAPYSGPAFNCKFAIKYAVNGSTYWDNNGTADYKASTIGSNPLYGLAAFGKNNVILTYGTYSDYPSTYFRCTVSTKILGTASKKVAVVYTTDNWATTKVLTNAWLQSSANGVDNWFVSDPAGSIGNVTYKFAISYNYGTATYWDNNFTQNYTVATGKNAF